ncbi:hypothetical protein [Yoonia sp. R2-816]|uniref:hypothetical protein n=1 Tax=Yoonia sp. R2-816 TaxID=3342638 RepID=UPI00372D5965
MTNVNPATEDMPHIVDGVLQPLDVAALAGADDPGHPPRILLRYGLLREVS